MRSFDASIQAALDAGRVVRRDFIKFEFTSATRGLWTGVGDITYDSLVYVGAARVLQISDFSGTTDGTSVGVEVRISSIPNTDLTPDVFAEIEDEDYNKRPATIYRGFYDPVTRAIIDLRWQRLKGIIDFVEHLMEPGGQAHLVFHIESRRLDDLRTGYRMRSDEDQALIDSNDKGLEYVAKVASQVIDWGRQPDKPKGQKHQPRRTRR